jgi:protein-glucosylgalactosylhydroxylysine glucosidase
MSIAHRRIGVRSRLPMVNQSIDLRIMAYVGNGHIATVVFSDSIYMNGIYNGRNSTSHRARIPSTIDWRFQLGDTLRSQSYAIDFNSGAFIEKLETNDVRIERRIFASQEYDELLLVHVELTRLGSKGTRDANPRLSCLSSA